MTLATHDDIRNFIPPADCLKGKNILVTGAGWHRQSSRAFAIQNMARPCYHLAKPRASLKPCMT